MSTLLLRLASPLQSWGCDDKFIRRGTTHEPTKSGVIGLLAAALGRSRESDLSDLTMLKFGVRSDQPGQLLRDYHTACFDKKKPPYVTERYYLSDAVFLVGLEGDDGLLQRLDEALNEPAFPLFLGRRSCPPSGRISLGVRKSPLKQALHEESWQASLWYQKRSSDNPRLTLTLDAEKTSAYTRRDTPLSFDQSHRKYVLRHVEEKAEAVAVINNYKCTGNETEHNPFAELEGDNVLIQD